MAGPWEKFQNSPAPVSSGPWARFSGGVSEDAPVPSLSGDELRAKRAGNTRDQLNEADNAFAYHTAFERGDAPEQRAIARGAVDRDIAASPFRMKPDIMDAAARGVPILGGLVDEINAFGNAPLSAAGLSSDKGEGYARALDYERAREQRFSGQHPVQEAVGNIGGAVATGAVAGPAVAAGLRALPSTAAALGASMGLGAGAGAADGFARGEGGQDRLEKLGIGSAIGATASALGPAVGAGASAVYSRIAEALNASRNLAPLGLSRPSANVLQRILEADGTLRGPGAANIAAAGPDAMLVDAGYGTRQALDTIMQSGGEGATLAREAVEQRANAAGQRITGALDQHLGAPVGIQTAEEGLRTGSAAARGNAYDAAYSQPIDYATQPGMALEGLIRDRVPAAAINRANSLMRLEGQQSQQIMAQIAPDGTVTFQRMPDVRQIDYIKRALDDEARAGEGAGAMGGQTAVGRAYEGLARQLRDALGQAVPEYGTALRTAAEPIAARRALQFGSEMMAPGVTRDEVARTLQGMTPPELAQARSGIRSAIDEKLANVRAVASDPNVDARQAMQAFKDLSSDAARDKVRLAIGDQAAEDLFRELDQAGRALELRAGTARNSATFPRQAMNEAINAASDPGPVGHLMRGDVPKASKALVQALTGLTPGRDARIGDEVRAQIAQALVGTRGPQASDALRRIAAALDTSRSVGATARRLGSLVGGVATGSGYQAGQQWIAPELRR